MLLGLGRGNFLLLFSRSVSPKHGLNTPFVAYCSSTLFYSLFSLSNFNGHCLVFFVFMLEWNTVCTGRWVGVNAARTDGRRCKERGVYCAGPFLRLQEPSALILKIEIPFRFPNAKRCKWQTTASASTAGCQLNRRAEHAWIWPEKKETESNPTPVSPTAYN